MDRNAVAALADGIARGDRAALAAGLNLLDDRRGPARADAARLLDALRGRRPVESSRLVGMTGPPGVGKSSLAAALIPVWRARGLSVGVLAVDPSSPISGGALLGDRLRMKTAGDDDAVFIRSLASRGEFGGLSAEVWPMSLLLLAAFDVVLVETVGVGQREVDIAQTCDTTCFVAQPGSGDSIQFLKAGVLEVPHVLVVNKEDMGAVASRTLSELTGTVSGDHPDGDWRVRVLSTSATARRGIEALADVIEEHHRRLVSGGKLPSLRRRHQAHWIVKRLEDEYGSAGVRRLGGAQAVLDEQCAREDNPLDAYAACTRRLEEAPATGG